MIVSFQFRGCTLSAFTLSDFLLLLLKRKETKVLRSQLILPATANEFVQAWMFPTFKKTLQKFDYLVTDGMPLVWLARLHGLRAERIYGPDLMLAVLGQGQQLGVTHYLYGTTQSVLARLESQLTKRFPQAKIVGSYAPPFRKLLQKEEQAVIKKINKARPDFVWVSLGGRKQVEWAVKMKDKLKVHYIIPVGAAFDFISGNKPQAPQWVRIIGLEWLFRLITEPQRLWQRYVLQIPIFLVLWVIEVCRIFLKKLKVI